ncbi:hypothetical protein DYBT9275_02066 [Dyadobacter sp. CECT 9275]|uniref:Lysoplasmalogenase n=1 Tax=Dyadobacter helix TaxID=2822344 RepID=A0A916JBI4_9BACT|nr:lysoplasmalogenase [Dyadobacter sp. CECT 9275]CAG4998724.1 hypothetical protein DYBT9275_02066 [Dyadobacter sp. CECT 9275]
MKEICFFTTFFFGICLINITAELYDIKWLVYCSKPCIMMSLFFFLIYNSSSTERHTQNLFIAGMVFALLGDIFLMIRASGLFLPGLAAFLVMQWIYTSVFLRQSVSLFKEKFMLWYYIPFIGYATLLVYLLFPALPDQILKTGVAVYAASIATMAYAALLRRHGVSTKSFQMVFTGAILFVLSDSLIAINRFLTPVPLVSIWVMGTYATAQYLIVTGIRKEKMA